MSALTKTQLVAHLENVVSRLLSWKGKTIKIVESISHSRDSGGHDRHFATRTSFELVVAHAGWVISGGRLMVLGEHAGFGYEIAFDNVSMVSAAESEISITEQFEHSMERLTIFSLSNN